MSEIDIEAIRNEWLVQCGPCDYGMVEMGCACPSGEPRLVIGKLIAEVERQGQSIRQLIEYRNAIVAENGQFRDRLRAVRAALGDPHPAESRPAVVLDVAPVAREPLTEEPAEGSVWDVDGDEFRRRPDGMWLINGNPWSWKTVLTFGPIYSAPPAREEP